MVVLSLVLSVIPRMKDAEPRQFKIDVKENCQRRGHTIVAGSSPQRVLLAIYLLRLIAQSD